MENAESIVRLPFDVGKNITDAISQAQDPRSDLRARFRALRDMLGTGLARLRDAAQPARRPAPALRLAGDEPGGDQGA